MLYQLTYQEDVTFLKQIDQHRSYRRTNHVDFEAPNDEVAQTQVKELMDRYTYRVEDYASVKAWPQKLVKFEVVKQYF